MKYDKEQLQNALVDAAAALFGRKSVTDLTERQLELLWHAFIGAGIEVARQQEAKREAAPNRLRLAAEGGELTSAGQRIIRARTAARSRRAAKAASA